MSAKGRKKAATGKAAEKPDSEFYPTPSWCVTRLLDHVHLPGGFWLEPSAGDGAIIRAVKSVRNDVTWTAVELRPECARPLGELLPEGPVIIDSYLSSPWACIKQAVTLGNPPFSLASKFVQRALTHSDVVIMLLRLNFLGSSSKRRHLFESAGMPDVYVLPERPSFTNGDTDATEYGWLLWKRDRSQEGKVRILWDKAQQSLFEGTP